MAYDLATVEQANLQMLPVNERDAGVAVDDIAELVQELVLHLGDVPLYHLAHHLAGVEVAVVADHLRAMEPLVVLPLQLLRQYARLGAADELLVLALLPPEVFHPLPRRHVVVELELIAVRPRHGAAHVDALEVFDRGPLGLGVGDGEAERAVRLGLGLEGDVVEHAGGGERVELVAQLRPGVDAAGAQRRASREAVRVPVRRRLPSVRARRAGGEKLDRKPPTPAGHPWPWAVLLPSSEAESRVKQLGIAIAVVKPAGGGGRRRPDAAAVGGGAACGRRGEERRTGSPAGRRSRVRGRGAAPDGVELGGPSVPAAAALKRAGEDDDQIAEKSVPAAVFGELGKRTTENREEESSSAQENEQLGTLERIKRRRQ
uniref:Uncharacterized protein n=1 Tax=Oryza glumipatula TaxID=40148 RepID=A0A0E0BN02_9ORYZ